MAIPDLEMLTDERSEIAERLSVAAHSWKRQDATDHRDPAAELDLILEVLNELNARRLRLAKLEAALRRIIEMERECGAMHNGDWSPGEIAQEVLGTDQ